MRGRIELTPGTGFALTTNAMIRYQEAAGESFFEGLKCLDDGDLDVRRLRLIVWCGLQDRTRTQDDAGDLIDELGLKETAGKLIEAVRAAFPEAVPGDAPGNAAAPGK